MTKTRYVAILIAALTGCVSDRPSLVGRLEVGTPVPVNDTVSVCVGEKKGTSLRGITIFEKLPNGLSKTIEAESGVVTEIPGTGVAVFRMRDVHIGGDIPTSTNAAVFTYEVRYKPGNQQ